jgi:succinate dehydrogenase / fumarate reductase flavoprotein subunit
MDKYSPKLGANTDPHYNVIGMAYEAREGRGPFYFDISQIKPEDRELMTKPQTGWQMLNYQKLVNLGIDFFTQNTEWMPQVIGSFGGLSPDINGFTNVPGLFGAGRALSMDPGVYMGGFALCLTAVTGHMTGESVADYIITRKPSELDIKEVSSLKNRLYFPLGKAGMTPKQVLRKVQEALFPYDASIIKSEASLKGALAKIERVKEELLPQMTAKDSHYLMKLIEVRAMAFTAELYLRASLMRTETRGGHYREDYPDRDNKNWLKWILISQENDKLSFRTAPVPLDKYKFKPTRYYMDNFIFPR